MSDVSDLKFAQGCAFWVGLWVLGAVIYGWRGFGIAVVVMCGHLYLRARGDQKKKMAETKDKPEGQG